MRLLWWIAISRPFQWRSGWFVSTERTCRLHWRPVCNSFHSLTIGWIKAEEHDPQRHSHVALIAGAPLDCSHAEELWQSIAAPRYKQAGQVKPYRVAFVGLDTS